MISVTALGEVDSEHSNPSRKRRQSPATCSWPAANSGAPSWACRCSNAKSTCLRRGARGTARPLTGFDEVLLERQLKPEARVDVVEELVQARSRAHLHDRHLRRSRLRSAPHCSGFLGLRRAPSRGQNPHGRSDVRDGPGIQPGPHPLHTRAVARTTSCSSPCRKTISSTSKTTPCSPSSGI